MLPRSFRRLVRVTSNQRLSIPIAIVMDGVTFDVNARGRPLHANFGIRPESEQAGGMTVSTARQVVSFSLEDLAHLPRGMDEQDKLVAGGVTYGIDQVMPEAFGKVDVVYVRQRS